MRGVARVALTVASAVSLVVFGVAVWGWVRSYQVMDYLAYVPPSKTEVAWVGWVKGALTYNHVKGDAPMPIPAGFNHVEYRPPPRDVGVPTTAGTRVHWDAAGFVHASGYSRPGRSGGVWFRLVSVPLWALAVVAAALPVVWGVARRRRRGDRPRCGGCGAAVGPGDVTCRECGWPVAGKARDGERG